MANRNNRFEARGLSPLFGVLLLIGAVGIVACDSSGAESRPAIVPTSVGTDGPTAETPKTDPTPPPEDPHPVVSPVDPPKPDPTSPPDGGAPNLVRYDIELPTPQFKGTPKNVEESNMEEPRDGPRPPFYAPEGLTNVALGKPVSASDDEPIIGEVEMVTDGDKEGTDGSFVEFGFGTQWVQIDLEAEFEIYAIVVWHFHGEPRVYRDVVVRVATDPDFIDVTTVYNNDHDNSSGQGIGTDKQYFETHEGKLIQITDGVTARYVRLYSNGNTSTRENHYIEVEVYARPVK